PVSAALSDAATASSGADDKLDIVLVADGSDSCDVDLCVTADALKQKAKGLRIHVIGFNAKPEQLEPLSCVATATGGKFVAATNNSELEQGLAVVLGAIATSMPAQVVTVPMPDWDQGAPADDSPPPSPSPELTEPGESSIGKSAGAGPAAVGQQNGETAINKSDAPPLSKPQALAQRAPTSPAAASQPQDPVPVTFKALVTEAGPKLQSGLTWRVYASKAEADGHYELISTHRESTPTAALLPGEYLVNAAYGLSNLTKKVKVESGQSIEETFILNTGGLKLTAVLADGQPLPEGNVHFNVLSDEQDQFGNRRTILADAKPGMVVRLNAGAYHVVSLYGDANANVGVDVTVEPGRITEATIKHTGAKITFKLVQTLGGEALADTKWKILTSAGDEVKSNVGALPTHILAAGSYVVVADHGGLNYTRKFSIEPGQPKQIEVAIEDGPTSPEALKALLEPPEPPTSGAGTYAGDGGPESGMGFDGFSSAPADPNAPLINPGALFRPSR
ncbi:MAG: hypothetical protein ACREDO_02200, partial [Methyloceanibacter sp.]